MNIIFSSQSVSLDLFYNILDAMKKIKPVNNVGFFISDKNNYIDYTKHNKQFSLLESHNLFEWDLKKESLNKNIDFSILRRYEEKFKANSLWNAFLTDRRFALNQMAQLKQTYDGFYNHNDALKFLSTYLKAIEDQVIKVKPSVIVSLNLVSIYDYLYYFVAKFHKIKYMQLRLTRIENFITITENPFYSKLPELNNRLSKKDLSDFNNIASKIIKKKSLRYEGSINKNLSIKDKIKDFNYLKLFSLKFYLSQDSSYHSEFKRIFFRVLRKKFYQQIFKSYFDDKQILNVDKHFKYALFPMNTEPEVALMAYAKQYKNQIETIRLCAESLPVDWKLIVKEHPNAFGYRSKNYYKKIKNIPNVILISPKIDNKNLFKIVDLCFVVYGTIAFESILNKIPLITFTQQSYSFFSNKLVRYVKNHKDLTYHVKSLFKDYSFNEDVIRDFIVRLLSNSVRANMFTSLLGKSKDRKSFKIKSKYNSYNELANLIIKKYEKYEM